VVGDGLDRVEVAVGGVVGVDTQAAGAAAVRRTRLVIGGSGGLLKVIGYCGDLEGRLGQRAEELRQLGLHGRQVAAIGVEQGSGRGGLELGIGLEAGAEAGQILKAEFLRDDEHLRFVTLHFVQADLVNLGCGQVGGGGAAQLEGVVLCAVGERRDAGLGAAGGNVADLKKAGKAQIGRQDFFCDSVQRFCLDALLLGGRDRGRKTFERQRQG
jgi:hypothetical protein